MSIFAVNPEEMPKHKWYHFPMENIKQFDQKGEASFMIRMLQARNLMIYFSLLLILAILISLAL